MKLIVLLCLWSSLAFAETAKDTDTEEKPLQQIGEDQLGLFELQRGFYFSTDVGVFLTFGGVRGYSDAQPYMAIKAGYDLNDYLSLQLVASTGFSSGNATSSNNNIVSYGLYSFGAEVVGAYRPLQRFAIEPRLGAGMARINPEILLDDQTSSAFDPQLMYGVDFKYLTLLTDFSAGVSLTGYYILGANIPAASVGGVFRYTF